MRSICLRDLLLTLLMMAIFLTAYKHGEKAEAINKPTGKLDVLEFRHMLEKVNPGLRDPVGVTDLIRRSVASFRENLVNNSGPDSVYCTGGTYPQPDY